MMNICTHVAFGLHWHCWRCTVSNTLMVWKKDVLAVTYAKVSLQRSVSVCNSLQLYPKLVLAAACRILARLPFSQNKSLCLCSQILKGVIGEGVVLCSPASSSTIFQNKIYQPSWRKYNLALITEHETLALHINFYGDCGVFVSYPRWVFKQT